MDEVSIRCSIAGVSLNEKELRRWAKSHEVTATGGSEIPLIGGAGGLERYSLSKKDVWG